MTFKDLQRLISSQPDFSSSNNSPQQLLLTKLRNKPFWLWDSTRHKEKARVSRGHCCFNHIIGLPRKDGIEKSIFDYEEVFYDFPLIPEFFYPSKHKDRDDGRTMTRTERKDWLIKSQVIHFDSIFHIHEKHYYIVFVLPVLFLQSLLQHFL